MKESFRLKNICLYCNWKVKVTENGFYVAAIHAAYLRAFFNSNNGKIILLSNISRSPVNDGDVFFDSDKICLISLPAFSSYFSSVRYFFDIASCIKKAYRTAEFFYIRTPEPFAWLFGVWNVFGHKTLNYHVVSNPLEVIWSNKKNRFLNRVLKFSTFYPEYLAVMISAYFNKISCNGYSAKDKLPFFVKKRAKVLIESTKLESDFDCPLLKQDDYFNPECIKFLIVTRFFPGKGLDVALKAFSKVTSDKKYELLIAGDGPEFNLINSLSNKLGLSDRVKFLGNVKNGNDLNKVYNDSHIFINPSLSETGPRVLLEAMAYNLYCISTEVGYARYVLSDEKGNVHGRIITPGSVNEMEVAIISVLDNFKDIMSKAEKGRQLSKRFTLDSFVKSVILDNIS
ncbi:glycosyltransferase family 4 protein [Aeromonas veronii]